MSGTDHNAQPGWDGPQPVMVLVDPQMGENIGAAARGMLNFGLEHMRLVNPRDGWPNPATTATASGAAKVLDRLSVHDSVAKAVGDLDYVYATTARSRDLTKPVVTPETAMGQAREMIAAGKKVGVLFGPARLRCLRSRRPPSMRWTRFTPISKSGWTSRASSSLRPKPHP